MKLKKSDIMSLTDCVFTNTHTHSLSLSKKSYPTFVQKKKRRQVRYVGTLRELDEKTKSVILVNVRSFGTEHRQSATPIRPQAKLYPIIKFENENVSSIEVLSSGPPAVPQQQYGYPPQNAYAPRMPTQQQQQRMPQNAQFNPYGGYGGYGQMFARPQMNPQWNAYYAQQQQTTTTMDGSECRTISRWFQRSSWSSSNDELDSEYNDEYDENTRSLAFGRPPSSNTTKPTTSSTTATSTTTQSTTSSSSSVWNKPSTYSTNTKPATTTWSKAATTISTNKPSWNQVTASSTYDQGTSFKTNNIDTGTYLEICYDYYFSIKSASTSEYEYKNEFEF